MESATSRGTPLEPESPDSPRLNPKSVAEDWIERCADDFALIARTKETFYRDIYNDERWRDCYSFADLSRRYSSLIRLIFAGVKRRNPAISPPSQTELNAWFQLFAQREQLTEANVPEHLLPSNRGISAALASATAKIADPKRKTETQSAILLKLDQESQLAVENGRSALPFTAAAVREVAASMGHRKHRVTRPLEYRELHELDAEAWGSITLLVADLRTVVLKQLPAAEEHTKVLTLARKLEGCCLRPSRFVFGVFDSKECFTALLVENYKAKLTPIESGVKLAKGHVGYVTKNGAGTCWSSTGFDIVPKGELVPLGEELPPISCQGEGGLQPSDASKVVLVMDEKAADKVVDEAIAALQQTVVPIPLDVMRDWESRGGIPDGCYVDEVLEPTVDDEPVDEDSGDSV